MGVLSKQQRKMKTNAGIMLNGYKQKAKWFSNWEYIHKIRELMIADKDLIYRISIGNETSRREIEKIVTHLFPDISSTIFYKTLIPATISDSFKNLQSNISTLRGKIDGNYGAAHAIGHGILNRFGETIIIPSKNIIVMIEYMTNSYNRIKIIEMKGSDRLVITTCDLSKVHSSYSRITCRESSVNDETHNVWMGNNPSGGPSIIDYGLSGGQISSIIFKQASNSTSKSFINLLDLPDNYTDFVFNMVANGFVTPEQYEFIKGMYGIE